jgi:hypothetical protein
MEVSLSKYFRVTCDRLANRDPDENHYRSELSHSYHGVRGWVRGRQSENAGLGKDGAPRVLHQADSRPPIPERDVKLEHLRRTIASKRRNGTGTRVIES